MLVIFYCGYWPHCYHTSIPFWITFSFHKPTTYVNMWLIWSAIAIILSPCKCLGEKPTTKFQIQIFIYDIKWITYKKKSCYCTNSTKSVKKEVSMDRRIQYWTHTHINTFLSRMSRSWPRPSATLWRTSMYKWLKCSFSLELICYHKNNQ